LKNAMNGFAKQLLAVTVVLFLASYAFGANDSNSPVAKPLVKFGDRWTYRSVDYWTNISVFTIESRVVFVGTDEISMTDTVTLKGSKRTTDSFYKSDWATMTSSDGTVYDPPFRLLKFPLQVGATYEATWQAIATKKATLPIPQHHLYQPGPSRSEATVKVVGWEDVLVPAGKFRALKLEARGTYSRLESGCSGPILWDMWYVPEVKRWVKLASESSIDYICTNQRPRSREGFELVDFSVQ